MVSLNKCFPLSPCLPLLRHFIIHSICYEVRAVFIDANLRIKGIQIGDNESKIVNFADDTTIFLRDFSCFVKIELI